MRPSLCGFVPFEVIEFKSPYAWHSGQLQRE
jgi:hypothetical protein